MSVHQRQTPPSRTALPSSQPTPPETRDYVHSSFLSNLKRTPGDRNGSRVAGVTPAAIRKGRERVNRLQRCCRPCLIDRPAASTVCQNCRLRLAFWPSIRSASGRPPQPICANKLECFSAILRRKRPSASNSCNDFK